LPPLSRISSPVLEKLARDLRFAPRDALLRDVDRVEELARDVDPKGSYPEDFVVFRITGYRSDSTETKLLSGETLLADLSALAERICDAAGMKLDELKAGSSATLAELSSRWNVSRKTVDRWRREGLIARRVLGSNQRPTLVVRLEVAEAFEGTHRDSIARASGFSRIPSEIQHRMLRRASVYRARFGCSLNQAAQRLAQRYGRSPEAVRQLLKKHDRVGAEGAAADRGSITVRERRVYFRVWQRGLDPVWIAKRTRRAATGVRRAINIERAQLLRELAESGALDAPTAPTFARPEASEVLLSPDPVRTGLGRPGLTDLSEFLADARKRTVPIGAEELSRRVAMCLLMHRAKRAILELDRGNPSAAAIDRVETDLRWVLRLKAELMRPHWALAIETVESQLSTDPGRGLGMVPTDQLPELLANLRDALAEAVDHYEPFRSAEIGGRLAGSVALAVAKIGPRWAKKLGSEAVRAPRAQARVLPGVRIRDWTRSVASWQRLLEPDDRAMGRLATLEPSVRRVIEARFGLSGLPPRTLTELATQLRSSPTRLARTERTAIRLMRGLKPKPSRAS